jgi:hypothetical protein
MTGLGYPSGDSACGTLEVKVLTGAQILIIFKIFHKTALLDGFFFFALFSGGFCILLFLSGNCNLKQYIIHGTN